MRAAALAVKNAAAVAVSLLAGGWVCSSRWWWGPVALAVCLVGGYRSAIR